MTHAPRAHETKRERIEGIAEMSRMGDFVLEIAEAIAGDDGDVSAVTDSIVAGRLQLGAVAPSGRILIADRGTDDPLLSLVTEHGYGLVARVNGSGWKRVRGDGFTLPAAILPSGFDTFEAEGGAILRVYALPNDEPTDIAMSAGLVAALVDEIASFGADS